MRQLQAFGATNLSLPPQSYVYKLTSSPDVKFLAAISSDDSLRLVNRSTLQPIADGIFPKVNQSVTCLKPLKKTQGGLEALVTAGRDGFVKFWDVRESKKCVLDFKSGELEN